MGDKDTNENIDKITDFVARGLQEKYKENIHQIKNDHLKKEIQENLFALLIEGKLAEINENGLDYKEKQKLIQNSQVLYENLNIPLENILDYIENKYNLDRLKEAQDKLGKKIDEFSAKLDMVIKAKDYKRLNYKINEIDRLIASIPSEYKDAIKSLEKEKAKHIRAKEILENDIKSSEYANLLHLSKRDLIAEEEVYEDKLKNMKDLYSEAQLELNELSREVLNATFGTDVNKIKIDNDEKNMSEDIDSNEDNEKIIDVNETEVTEQPNEDNEKIIDVNEAEETEQPKDENQGYGKKKGSFKTWKPIAIGLGIIIGAIVIGSALLNGIGIRIGNNVAKRTYPAKNKIKVEQTTNMSFDNYMNHYGLISVDRIQQLKKKINNLQLNGFWIGGATGIYNTKTVKDTKIIFNILAENNIIPGTELNEKDGNIGPEYYKRVKEIQNWLNKKAKENKEYENRLKEINKKMVNNEIVSYNGDKFFDAIIDEDGFIIAIVPTDGYFGEQTRASLVAWLSLIVQYNSVFA